MILQGVAPVKCSPETSNCICLSAVCIFGRECVASAALYKQGRPSFEAQSKHLLFRTFLFTLTCKLRQVQSSLLSVWRWGQMTGFVSSHMSYRSCLIPNMVFFSFFFKKVVTEFGIIRKYIHLVLCSLLSTRGRQWPFKKKRAMVV